MRARANSRSLGRRLVAAVAVAATALAGSLVGSASAVAAPAATVSGTITLAGAAAPAGTVQVTLRQYTWFDEWASYTDRVVTVSAGGAYAFDGLGSGWYDVLFEYVSGEQYADMWFSGGGTVIAEQWLDLAVDDQVVLDADLDRAASLTGTVKDAAGRALAGVTVTARYHVPDAATPVLETTAVTATNGTYRVAGLLAGPYQLVFSHPSFSTQVRGELPGGGVPDHVVAPAGGALSALNMTLYRTATIKGLLTCAECVTLWPADVGARVERLVGSAWVETGVGVSFSNSIGAGVYYTASASLAPGTYRVVFWRVSSPSLRAYTAAKAVADGGTVNGLNAVLGVRWDRGDFVWPRAGADVAAITGAGELVVYNGSGTGGWYSTQRGGGPERIGTGWGSFTSVFSPGDFDGNGGQDFMARASNGYLYLYGRDGSARFTSPVKVGSGWNAFTAIFSTGDFDGDRHTDVFARATDGTLYLYPGNGNGGWLPRKTVGSGWNAFTAVLGSGDFDGDGNADVIARGKTGLLFLYPGDGSGGWLARKQIGSGWSGFTTVFSPGDFTGDAHPDVMARASNGVLYLYPGNGSGGWLARTQIGSGWQSLRIVS